MLKVDLEGAFSKSTGCSLNGFVVARNVSIYLLLSSLPLLYKLNTVIMLTNNSTMENETKLDRSERGAAIFLAILYPVYTNKMARGCHSTDDFSLIEAPIHSKLAEQSKDACGYPNLE